MNELKIFENAEFGQVRTLTVNCEPYFVGKDVADALGYSETNAMTRRLDEDDFMSTKLSGMNMNSTVVNESGLYAAILGSKLRTAKKFKHWVTSEVLPSIRKTGTYNLPQTYSEALRALADVAEQNEALKVENKEMTPKAIFADAVSTSHTSILVGDLAKLICQNGYQIGQRRLFEWLRNNGYLVKCGASRNMPLQRYVEQGLFEVKESTLQNPDGSVRITKTTKVTGKGQVYFVNKFIGYDYYDDARR